MNTTYIIIALVLGVGIGVVVSARRHIKIGPNQHERKQGNKQKILDFLRENAKGNNRATNDDIQKLLGVSDATATRYLDQLEKAGKITQVGKTGQAVFYKLK